MRGGLYIAASILTISYAIASAILNAAQDIADEFDFGSDPRTAMLGEVAATRNKAGGKGAEQAAATEQERVALHLKGGL